MFGFLKDKLKEAIGKFSKKVDESVADDEVIETKKPVQKTTDKKKPSEKKKVPEKKVSEKKKPEKKSIPVKKDISKKEPETVPKKEVSKKEPEKKEVPKKESEKKVEEHKKGFFESLKDKFVKPKVVTEAVDESTDVVKEEEHVKALDSVEVDHEALDEEDEKSSEEIEPDESDVEIVETKKVADIVEDELEDSELEEESEDESEEESDEESDEEPEESEEESDDEPEEKKSFFGAISDAFTKKSLTEEKFEQLFFELEVVLLENNVAYEVVDKIKSDLSKKLVNTKLSRGKIQETILESLKESIEGLFDLDYPNLMKLAREKKDKPFVIVMMGVNGSGKTTTMAKLGYHFKNAGLSCVFAAGDTFRAAAIQQLEEHAKALDIKMIKQDYGADSAAVAFDAVKYAKSKNIDVVLIDTAGRLHSNTNLMNELKKVVRVANADFKIFVGEAITGNDCVEQAVKFNDELGIDGIILTKADIDDKGGASISVSYVTQKPILYLGMGQSYPELEQFESKKIVENLGL